MIRVRSRAGTPPGNGVGGSQATAPEREDGAPGLTP